MTTGTEIARIEKLPDVITGEILEATPENAARVILAARLMKDKLADVIADATDVARAESERVGSKTIETAYGKLTLAGGDSVEYDAMALREALELAECPEERINQAITEEISYKVNRSVLRSLAAANPDYKAAIELAERPVVKRWSASVKERP